MPVSVRKSIEGRSEFLGAMNIFDSIKHAVAKTPERKLEGYLSLVIDDTYIGGSGWELFPGGKAEIFGSFLERTVSPSWDERIRIVDTLIEKIEEEKGNVTLTKVVFGLGDTFLTEHEDIDPSTRPHLKKLTKELSLTPVGFVPITTAMIHFLKQREGVPTSVILIGVSEKIFDVMIYRVGILSHRAKVERTENHGEDIESVFKTCPDSEVLPSRIFLFGADDVRVEEVKASLLRYQWMTKANFLHYPKIELFPIEHIVSAVAESGASELAKNFSDMPPEPTEDIEMSKEEVQEHVHKDEIVREEISKEYSSQEPGLSQMVVVQPESLGFRETDTQEEVTYEDLVAHTKSNKSEEQFSQKELVIHDEEQLEKSEPSYEKDEHEEIKVKKSVPFQIPKSIVKAIGLLKKIIPKKVFLIVPFLLIVAGITAYMMTAVLPIVTITLRVLPEKIIYEDTLTIDPNTTVVDKEKKILPGKRIEKIISGEKTTPVTGKKKIGEAAKGTIIISNKTTNQKTFKKGTIILSDSLKFSLTDDITIASASEDFRGSTWGTGTVGAIAVSIGPESNIAANAKFVFADIGSDVAVGRNEQPFAGGTSKEVTVVSRVDYDGLLKTITAELIEKAKAELGSQVDTEERMIDATIKTTVKEKKFLEEIDQEAKDLHGSLTVVVSAVVFNEGDAKSFLMSMGESSVPSGYAIDKEKTSVSLGSVVIGKDGKMTAKILMKADALPVIDINDIKKKITGENLSVAGSLLRQIKGVASAEFAFVKSWTKDKIPSKAENVHITILSTE